MSALDPVAELRKLAHTLGVTPDELSMVSSLPAEDLRTLRKQAGQALFEADRHAFARVATLSKTVPVAVAAKLTEATLPPLLAARTAELLEPAKAADMVSRLSERYLADVSAAMDATRAPEVVAAISPAKVTAVGAELARREEWIVIGAFVSVISPQALAESIRQYSGGDLLRISFVMEDLDRLDDIGDLLSDNQLDEMLAAAVDDGLWREMTELLVNLSDVSRLVARHAEAGAATQKAFTAAAESGDLDAAAHALLTGS